MDTTTPVGTMTVRVRDDAAEAATWGRGLTSPIVRTVTIPVVCPRCGGPRGEPRNDRRCDDGAWFDVDVWRNACGHVDTYPAVLREAQEFAAAWATAKLDDRRLLVAIIIKRLGFRAVAQPEYAANLIVTMLDGPVRPCSRCGKPITDPENAPDDDSALCRDCGDPDDYPDGSP